MNKLASALMGGSSSPKAPGAGSTSLGENGPLASAGTTAQAPRGLAPTTSVPAVPPATIKPLSPTAPAGAMTTPAVGRGIKTTPSAGEPFNLPKVAADALRDALLKPDMPSGMKPIAPPKPPAPSKPFVPKDPGTTKGFTLGATAGTI